MKAVILAGGLGTRLRPITYEIPKPLIPVHGITLTEQSMGVIRKAGVSEFLLTIGYLAERVIKHFGDGEKFGVKVDYVVETEPLGTAGFMHKIGRFEDTTIIINGDNLFDIDFNDLITEHKKSGAIATIALTEVEDPSAYGVARLKGTKILEFVEKPKKEEAPSKLINSGYYVVEPEIFDYLPKKDFVMFERDIWPILAREGKLGAYISDAKWFDTGTFESYERVLKEWPY